MEKAFRCSLCLTVFNNTDHRAFILSCGHSHCFEFINHFLDEESDFLLKRIKCSICKTISVYSDIEDITRNFGIESYGKNKDILKTSIQIRRKVNKFLVVTNAVGKPTGLRKN